MKRKHCLSILLTLAMLLSLSVCVGASASAEDTIASPMQQIKLISSQMDSLMQINTENPWYYCVADLDHNGCLEFIAASQHPDDRSTNLKIWTVSKDSASLGECRLSKADEESFPDIMTDTVDTYHDKDTDTWYYMVYDNAVISNAEVYTVKTAVNLKNGIIGYDPLAVEHTVVENGMKNVTHTDMNGINISPDQYNASGANAFAAAERGNTAFEWLTADKVSDQNNLTESYEVFLGTREPTETFPVPKPVALGGTGTAAAPTPTPSPVPVPAPTPVPQPQPQPVQPTYLTITKNPTNENKKVGGSAIFVACANAYDSLNWTFVSPDGGEYSPSSFVAGSGASVSGEYSTTITVSNVESWMNGWGAYCSFYFQGQTARTSTAYIYISDSPSPTPPSPTPSYGSMSGTAYSGGAGYAINLQNGTQVFVDSWNCNVEGQFYDGCSAIVYYIDYPSNANVYRADIFGNQGLIQYTTNSNGDVYALHEAYNPDGSTYNTVTCPACSHEVSMAEDRCPYCGYDIWGLDSTISYTTNSSGDVYELHEAYNADGSTYNTVTCPVCGQEVSMALDHCPNCGYDIWG